MAAGGAADRFWSELRTLYQAAGQPTLSRLVHLGFEQRPAVCISDSTINGWLNRKAVPVGRKNEQYLTAMLAFLTARAKSQAGYRPLPPGEWGLLLRKAQEERAAGRRTGRPRRPVGERDRPPQPMPDPCALRDAELEPARCRADSARRADRPRPRSRGDCRAGKGGDGGRGSALLIEGEPGIGKSALLGPR